MSLSPKEKAAPAGTALVNQSQTDITRNGLRTQVRIATDAALQYALTMAESGIPSFPCAGTKAPTCPSGYKAATTNADDLRALWKRHGGILIGVPTGAISGFDALDIDSRHGGDRWLADNAKHLPLTRTHGTRSGGFHFLFKHRDGVRNSAGKIASGVDVRGDGGFIIWWRATGLNVQNGSVLADWPEWLVEKLLPPPRQPSAHLPSTQCSQPYVQAALTRAMQTVATATDGSRNHTLNSEVWSLARFIPSGYLCAQQIATALYSAARAAGLSSQETIRTIASALRARGV
jgi:hypothetical protein